MIEIDTTKECFEASFEVCLRWALRREDKRSGANAWTPPNFRVRNGKSDLEQDDNNTKITCELPGETCSIKPPQPVGI